MATFLEITDYDELVELHKALRAARFPKNPFAPHFNASPQMADLARRVVNTLSEMEIERGHPEKAADWQVEIAPGGDIWKIAVRNATDELEYWINLNKDRKNEVAAIYLSPFTYSDEIRDQFIQEVDNYRRVDADSEHPHKNIEFIVGDKPIDIMNLRLPEEVVHEPTVKLIQCAYPHGIPNVHYIPLLHILEKDTSNRVLAKVIAHIRGGSYPIYMNDVIEAYNAEPSEDVLKTVMEKLMECGYEEWKAQD